MADAFSRFINRFSQLGLWQGILIPCTSNTVTHSLFANDTLLFGMSNVKEANHIKYALDLYSKVFGQRINANKSKIFIFNTNDVVAQRIRQGDPLSPILFILITNAFRRIINRFSQLGL